MRLHKQSGRQREREREGEEGKDRGRERQREETDSQDLDEPWEKRGLVEENPPALIYCTFVSVVDVCRWETSDRQITPPPKLEWRV